jgi:hypothetical protein
MYKLHTTEDQVFEKKEVETVYIKGRNFAARSAGT